jgi:hypothetical protein
MSGREKNMPGGYGTEGDVWPTMRKQRSPIRIKKSNQGKLRKATRTKKGSTIPVSTLRKLKNSKNPVTRRRATFALNARSFKKVGRKKK